jgi:hypothetical protein
MREAARAVSMGPIEQRAFQFRVGDLMGWVALLGLCFALARVATPLGVFAACVLAPALALTLRRASVPRPGGAPPGIAMAPLELARSIGQVLLAGVWAIVAFYLALILSVILVNFLIMVVMIVLIAAGKSPVYPESNLVPLLGTIPGVLAAVVAFVREYRRYWRLAGTQPAQLNRDPSG